MDAMDRRARWRRREDQPWTVGEHMDYERRVEDRLRELDSKLDRLTWLVAAGTGIVTAAAFFVGLASAAPL